MPLKQSYRIWVKLFITLSQLSGNQIHISWVYNVHGMSLIKIRKQWTWLTILYHKLISDQVKTTAIGLVWLTHWGRATHICVSKLTIIGSDNGLSPGRHQAIIWTIADWNIVNWTHGNKLQWNFNRNSNIFIQENAFENVVCEMASICLRLNVLAPPWLPLGTVSSNAQHKLCWLSDRWLHSVFHTISMA